MRSPRTIRALSAAIVLALGAAACGDEADDDPLAVEETTTTTAEAADDGGGDDGAVDDGDDADPGSDVEAPDLPDGWGVIEGDGVTIGAPDEWTGVPLAEFIMGGDDLEQLLPDVDPAMLNQASQIIEQGGVLLAFGPTVDDFTDNVNILAMPIPATMDDLEREADLGMAQLGADVDSIEPVDLPVGEALRVRYSLTFQGPEGPVTIQGVQFFIPQDRTTYVMTVSASADPGEVADGMASSFRPD